MGCWLPRQGRYLLVNLFRKKEDHFEAPFVFSSIDRGGPQRSDEDETSIRPFASKARVEKHLIAKISGQKTEDKTQYAILRTTTFYDNLMPNFIGRTFAGMWRAH